MAIQRYLCDSKHTTLCSEKGSCGKGATTHPLRPQKHGQIGDSISVDGGGDRVGAVLSLSVVFPKTPLNPGTRPKHGLSVVHLPLEMGPIETARIRRHMGTIIPTVYMYVERFENLATQSTR